MDGAESTISRIKELSKILDNCIDKKQKHPCFNCATYGGDKSMNLVCRRMLEDLLKEIDKYEQVQN